MKLSEITPIQVLGSVLVVNTVLAGGMTQLTDLFGATMANHILSVCILGSGICGGFIMNMGGLGSQARNVVAAGGSIEVGPNAKSSLATLAMDPAQNKIDAAPGAGAAVAAIAKAASVVLLAVILGALTIPQDAHAQIKIKTPGQIQQDIDSALKKTNAGLQKQVASVTAKVDPAQALSCDFTLLINLTPQNLVPTVKACLSDVNSTLVNDTQRALTSAKAYSGSGDNDAVNCLTPALAIFQAGVQVPAVPAVTAADGTVTTPAVPAQDPGPILLYQKYREFTLAGALTSCQAWFNGPINATAAAGIAGAGTAIAGAALLAPK